MFQRNQTSNYQGKPIPDNCLTDISKALECYQNKIFFNHALNQGNGPDILDIYSEVKLADKGGDITTPANSRPISTLSAFT